MKIAIIGAGISGLTSGYLLADQHDVTVFEANDYPGGHTHTIAVDWQGDRQAVDTGFIVYNERTYPHFIGLLDELGVSTQPTEMGFSVRCHATNFEYNGTNLTGMIADKRNLLRPKFYRMVRDILRFYKDTKTFLEQPPADQATVTVSEFAARKNYSQDFLRYHLLPMGAAIWSCALDRFGDFPFLFVARFYDNHGLIQVTDRPIWRVIQGGSQQYVEPLVSKFADAVRLSTPVETVIRKQDGVELLYPGGTERFDHVIFACHSDTALKILQQPDDTESHLLRQFPYASNVATLHTDESILPKSRKAWASWNYALYDEQADQPKLTYNMNILQSLTSPHTYCVTLNSEDRIDPAKIIDSYCYDHPLFSLSRDAAQTRHAELIGRRNISYCGAYWRNGFHEDGVVSALRVCQQWGIRPDWSDAPIEAAV